MPQLSLTVRIALALLLVSVPLPSFDQWLYDHVFQLQPKQVQKPAYVLVRVSEGKLSNLLEKEYQNNELSLALPDGTRPIWRKAFYESLISRLNQHSPKLIVFTTFFDWVDPKTTPPQSQTPILFSSLIDEEGKLVPPPPRLAPDAHFGFNNLFPDNDNVLRQSPLIYSSGKSLALKAYEFLKGSAPPVDLTQPIHIFFKGPAGTFPSLDAWDVFENTTDLALLRDQVVLIGREGSPSHDVETPFGKMSRLEIQGNIVRTFLESKQIQILSSPIQLLASFLTVVGAIGIILYFPLSVAWLLLMLFASVLVMLSYMSLIWFKAWWGLANPLFCILGTHLLLIGFKIGRQEEKQWRIQEESKYLKEMDEFKNNFVSLFSHDLKTPIAKIKAILDRLQSENPSLDPSVRQGLSGVERANNELARLISDILRITKMESMPIEPAKEVVDINRLVESAIQRLSFLFEEKEIKLVANLEPLFAMEGDPQLLLEVITNLLENAVKYSPSKSQVVIQTQETDHQVRVSVRDEGPGIPEEELPRVTSKFYRGKSVDKSTRGSGLGLYLAKYFVELHRGTLHLTSEPGRGTEVSFTLPIR